jgi:hypothetical protein
VIIYRLSSNQVRFVTERLVVHKTRTQHKTQASLNRERWYVYGDRLEVVKEFIYLRVKLESWAEGGGGV